MRIPVKVWAGLAVINFVLAAGFIGLAIKYRDPFGWVLGAFLIWNGANLLSKKVLNSGG